MLSISSSLVQSLAIIVGLILVKPPFEEKVDHN